MAYSRWHNSDWFIWVTWDSTIMGGALLIRHILDEDCEPQKFYPQQVRKMLKHDQFSAIRHFEPSVVRHLERYLQEEDK